MTEFNYGSHGLAVEAFVATLLYSLVGIAIMLLAIVVVNSMFKLNIHRELVKEHNLAFGILFGCMTIGISIIIASTIIG